MAKQTGCINGIIHAVKWMPVLVTISIFSWGWYAYAVQLQLYSVDNLAQKILCLVIFHALYVLAFWSYVQNVFTMPGKVPSRFYLSPEVCEELSRAPDERRRDEILALVVKKNDLPVACRTYLGGIRICEKCNLIKPDRCHHCSICSACILRMDHHCPWINNCVSSTNYKFFVLFLGYTFALGAFVGATTFPYFLKFWAVNPNQAIGNAGINSTAFNGTTAIINNDLSSPFTDGLTTYSMNNPHDAPFSVKFHILFLFFVSTMLSIGVMFLFCYHLHLLLHNRSTLESFRPPLMTYGPDRNAFNLGKQENVMQTFGRNKLLWFLPIFTTEGSGVTYELRQQLGAGDEEARQGLLGPSPGANSRRPDPGNTTDTKV